jgi:hypothetical protein
MSYISILRAVKTAAHAISVAAYDPSDLCRLISAKLLNKGTRSCEGKVFTNPANRELVSYMIVGPQKGHILATLAAIKDAPHSVNTETISRTTDVAYPIVASNIALLHNADLIKAHRSKRGYFFTNPNLSHLVSGLVADYKRDLEAQRPAASPTVRPVSTNGYTLSAKDKAILAKIKAAPHAIPFASVVPPAVSQADAALSIGFMMGLGLVREHSKKPGYFFTEPTKASVIAALLPAPAPVVPEGEVLPTDAALAICRLSKHGISMNGIWKAFEKLIAEGVIRADKRDNNKTSKEVRYFVRKGGPRMGDIRAKADARIAKLIAENENLVDLINAEVDAL